MGDKSKITWTDATWNCVTGCDKVSPGCKFCYADVLAQTLYKEKFAVTLRPERLDQPIRWKKPRRIFVNSMSDMFHKDIPEQYIKEMFGVMNQCPRHIFQILTKRPERMLEFKSLVEWTPNIWMGVSVESQEYSASLRAGQVCS